MNGRVSDRRILYGMFAVLIASALLVTTVVLINLRNIGTATQRWQHSYVVFDQRRDAILALDAEAQARIYDHADHTPRSLAGVRKARDATDAAVGRLLILTTDDGRQQSRLMKLDPLLAAWRETPLNADGIAPLLAARDQLRQFSESERTRLERRAEDTRRAFTISYWTLFLGMVISLGLTGAIWLRAAKVLIGARDAALRSSDLSIQLLRIERLNALGEMAGTLAHELSQPLSAANGYIGAAQRVAARNPGADPRMAGILRKANAQVSRATQMIRRMREFVERGPSEPRLESLSAMLNDACSLILAEAQRDGVKVRVVLDSIHDNVLADRIQVQQVLVNLLRNALEAMAATPRRELTIGLDTSDPAMARIYVSDTGSGISPEVGARMFQPFVSTKGHGMGVGLSLCRNIVETHGGRLWAASCEGGGATLNFTLPRTVVATVRHAA